MTKEVRIRILAIHCRPDTEPEKMETVSNGRYYFHNGKHYIEYEETDPENKETVRTHLSLKDGRLEIRKMGASQSRLEFVEGRRSRGQYDTPFGKMIAETEVKFLRVSESDRRIEIRVGYILFLNGEKISDSSVCIRILACAGRPENPPAAF